MSQIGGDHGYPKLFEKCSEAKVHNIGTGPLVRFSTEKVFF